MDATRAWIAWASGWGAWAWGWIGANYQPLAVVLAALGVAVTWRYVVLTRRLAEAANTSAAAAKVQADAALRQAEASSVGAQAAADQALSTRLIFEAAHRPYLDVAMQPWSFYASPDFFDFAFLLTNKGPVPAILVGCHAIVRLDGAVVAERPPDQRDAAVALFPGGEPEEFVFKKGGGTIIPLQGNLEAECRVEYRGFHEARYVTRIVARRIERVWKHVDMEIR